MDQINSKCQFKRGGCHITVKITQYRVMLIFGRSRISIPNITLQILGKLAFSWQYLDSLWLSHIPACKYQAEKMNHSVFALHKGTRAESPSFI